MAGDYPEWLVERVAAAAARGMDDTTDLYGDNPYTGKPWSADYIHEWEDAAVAVLDALEFTKRFSSGQLVAGRYVSWNHMAPATHYYCYRAQTEWREVPKTTDSVVD
jgi:hypothetical protein